MDGRFQTGKYALTPVALFATAALYRLEVIGLGAARPRWVPLGLFCGVVTSVLCQVFEFACVSLDGKLGWLRAALCYVPLWYGVRAVQWGLRAQLDALHYLWATLAMLPFWIGSWVWSQRVFQALPATQPEECFVVTAAGRGHHSLVGPFFELERGGVRRRANGQLRAFWRFEAQWQAASPRTHRAFRKFYGRLGPVIAARVTSAWRADLLFLALKPLEYLARAAAACLPSGAGRNSYR